MIIVHYFGKTKKKLGVDEPSLPRKRKAPRRLESNAPGSFPSTCEDHYHQIYFEAQDRIINCIDNRFDQPGYQT